jgi:hypothetical protein
MPGQPCRRAFGDNSGSGNSFTTEAQRTQRDLFPSGSRHSESRHWKTTKIKLLVCLMAAIAMS